MGTPVKSPVVKRIKADDGTEDELDDGQQDQTLTLRAMSKLLESTLAPLKSGIEHVRSHFGAFRAHVDKELGSINSLCQSIEDNMVSVSSRVDVVESKVNSGSGDESLMKRIQDLEALVRKMTFEPRQLLANISQTVN